MPKVASPAVQSLLDVTLPAMQAQTAAQFMRGVKHGFDALYEGLVEGSSRKKLLLALDEAFSHTRNSLRQRRMLELCSWPIFDKPALPMEATSLPEFLWLFCVPFVVRFSLEDIKQPQLLQGDVVDARAMLRAVATSGWMNERAVLSGFPALLTREDLHLYGPKNLAALFVHSELGEDQGMQALPLLFDEEIESGRVATLFLVGAARLPIGEAHLMEKQPDWSAAEALQQLVSRGLASQGLTVESVQSLPPCSMAEALFRCAGAGAVELEEVLALAKSHYGCKEIVLRHPMEGMAELSAVADDGDELALLPPFPFLEPKPELQACVRRLCESQGLPFKGAFSVAVHTGSMRH